MTRDEWLRLLIEYDVHPLAEEPEGFDLVEAKNRFARLTMDLLLTYGDLAARVHPKLQDRSYHGEIAIPWYAAHSREWMKVHGRGLSTRRNRDWLHVRVSNFGDLATAYFQTHDEGQDTPFQVEKAAKSDLDEMDEQPLRALLEQQGYRYVPLDVLLEPYTRGDSIHWWVGSWMNRYFGVIAWAPHHPNNRVANHGQTKTQVGCGADSSHPA